MPSRKPETVVYVPELISTHLRRTSKPTFKVGNLMVSEPTGMTISRRGEFESLFARGVDPWRYTSPYEQTKYEQTLSLLPPRVAERLNTPPPLKPALLPETVLFVSVAMLPPVLPTLLATPPPYWALLPETVLLVRVAMPRLCTPPPTLALLPETVLFVRVAVPPPLYTPPPAGTSPPVASPRSPWSR